MRIICEDNRVTIGIIAADMMVYIYGYDLLLLYKIEFFVVMSCVGVAVGICIGLVLVV